MTANGARIVLSLIALSGTIAGFASLFTSLSDFAIYVTAAAAAVIAYWLIGLICR